MTSDFHKRWLKVCAVGVGAFGPVFFLGSMLPTSGLARFTLDVVSLPYDGIQTFVDPTTRFLSAITGGVMFGWAVLIWGLSGQVYDANPEGVRRGVVAGMVGWFVLDGLGSVVSGNASNVGFNLALLLFAVGPMWWPARA